MARIDVVVTGLEFSQKLVSDFALWESKATLVMQQHVETVTKTMKTPKRQGGFTPIDTGFLIDSITSFTTVENQSNMVGGREVRGFIKVGAFYAEFVNDGTKFQDSQQFVEKSIGKHQMDLEEKLNKTLDEINFGGPSVGFTDY